MLDVEYIIRNMMKRFGIEDLIKSDEEEEEKIFETSNFFCFGVEDITCGVKKMFKPSNFSWFGVEDIMSGGFNLD